ncbi:hypothetical protein HWV62_26346 [Athelia sp. TMB]|nr:hypothetical protein HWV62_26346 [Athelia sp. TMB]
MEHKWLQDRVAPESVVTIDCESTAFRAQLVPGGEWLVLLCRNGMLHLRQASSGTAAVRVAESSFAEVVAQVGVNDGMSMDISVVNSGEIFLSLTIFGFWDTMFSTVFTLYRIDTKNPGFHLVLPPARRVHEKYEGAPAVAGGLWAFSWWRGSRRLLAIGSVSGNPHERREIVLDVGAFKFQATVTILPARNQVLLSSRAGLMLFNIPILQALSDGKPKTIRARPAWMHTFETLDEYRHPNVSQLDSAGGTVTDPSERLVILGGYHLRVLHLNETSRLPSECEVGSYSFQTHDPPRVHARNCLSSRRVFFCKDDMLQTCSVPEADDIDHLHHMTAIPVSIDEARVAGRLRVHDISWVEESGRLCLLVGQHHDYDNSRRSDLQIVIADF